MTRKLILLICWGTKLTFLLFYRRSNASLYGGNKEDLYDRLRRHAYPGKKSGKKKIGKNLKMKNENWKNFKKHFFYFNFDWGH